jgi:mono/diheme cytochrome c family protein
MAWMVMVMWRGGLVGVLGMVVGCGQETRDPDFSGWGSGGGAGSFDDGTSDHGSGDGGPGLDDREVVTADVPPPPVFGGTLLVLEDGAAAVASDPDRDVVWLVDLVSGNAPREIDVGEGVLPWRAVEDAHGLVHVVGRGTGEVISIDPVLGEIALRRDACVHPRGLAYDLALDRVVVACAEGTLVGLDADEPAVVLAELEPDLRDVLVAEDGSLRVTRFRSAQILTVDGDQIVDRTTLPTWSFTAAENGEDTGGVPEADEREATTAWRTVAAPGGGWLVVHHAATTRPLPTTDDPEGYGGPSCRTATSAAVTWVDDAGAWETSGALQGVVLPVDVAISHDEEWVAVAAAGGCDACPSRGLALLQRQGLTPEPQPCVDPIPVDLPEPEAQIVALAWTPEGRLLAQSREPAAIYEVDPIGGTLATHVLPGDSRLDTGHQLFHIDAGRGISCASCHPEGTDDGRVWSFEGIGDRHTPALDVGLSGTEPFHWNGELADFAVLVEQIQVGRMGGALLSPARVDAFEAWMYTLKASAARPTATEATERGEALFSSLGCVTCHNADTLAGGQSLVVGSGEEPLQVPPLLGVALHPPYMHDGRAATLEDAVLDMLARTRPDNDPFAADVADLVAYLQTL